MVCIPRRRRCRFLAASAAGIAGALVLVGAPIAHAVTFTSSPGTQTPDNGSVSDTIMVPLTDPVTDLNVALNVTGQFGVGDCDYDLTSPANTTVRIAARPFGPSDAMDVTFDDSGVPIPSFINVPLVTGTFQPSNPLSGFNGENPQGNWILTVIDAVLSDPSFCRINSWSLIFNEGPTPTVTQTATPSSTPTATPSFTATPTPTSTSTATDTPTDTPSATATATSTETPTATPTDTPRPLGAACTTPGHCASGFCEDGVCCDRACGPREVCNRTGNEGLCLQLGPVPAPALSLAHLAAALGVLGLVACAALRKRGAI